MVKGKPQRYSLVVISPLAHGLKAQFSFYFFNFHMESQTLRPKTEALISKPTTPTHSLPPCPQEDTTEKPCYPESLLRVISAFTRNPIKPKRQSPKPQDGVKPCCSAPVLELDAVNASVLPQPSLVVVLKARLGESTSIMFHITTICTTTRISKCIPPSSTMVDIKMQDHSVL